MAYYNQIRAKMLEAVKTFQHIVIYVSFIFALCLVNSLTRIHSCTHINTCSHASERRCTLKSINIITAGSIREWAIHSSKCPLKDHRHNCMYILQPKTACWSPSLIFCSYLSPSWNRKTLWSLPKTLMG